MAGSIVLVFLICSLILAHAAPSGQIHGNDLAEDLERLRENRNPKNLALADPEHTEEELPESELFEGDLLGIDKAAFADKVGLKQRVCEVTRRIGCISGTDVVECCE